MYVYMRTFLETPAFGMPGDEPKHDPCMVMRTAQGTHQPGWLISQMDARAKDWMLVDPASEAEPVPVMQPVNESPDQSGLGVGRTNQPTFDRHGYQPGDKGFYTEIEPHPLLEVDEVLSGDMLRCHRVEKPEDVFRIHAKNLVSQFAVRVSPKDAHTPHFEAPQPGLSAYGWYSTLCEADAACVEYPKSLPQGQAQKWEAFAKRANEMVAAGHKQADTLRKMLADADERYTLLAMEQATTTLGPTAGLQMSGYGLFAAFLGHYGSDYSAEVEGAWLALDDVENQRWRTLARALLDRNGPQYGAGGRMDVIERDIRNLRDRVAGLEQNVLRVVPTPEVSDPPGRTHGLGYRPTHPDVFTGGGGA